MLHSVGSWRAAPFPGAEFGPRPAPRPAELAIVVPTYNERENIDELVDRIGEALVEIDWELIVVDDDSPDGTAGHVRAIGRRDGRVRVLRRVGRRGLASACIEGMLATNAPVLAVMDADLQHDPALLSSMLSLLRDDRAEMVVASRHVMGGSIDGWCGKRALVSRVATGLCGARATQGITDPMSGFFMLRRRVFDDVVGDLSGRGFKILLDVVLSSARPLRIREVPLVFGLRTRGASKLGASVMWDYLLLLAEKRWGRHLPLSWMALAVAILIGFCVQAGVARLFAMTQVVNGGWIAALAGIAIAAVWTRRTAAKR